MITKLGHAPLESRIMRRPAQQHAGVTDAQHLGGLRSRRKRPRHRRAPESPDELASSHSITSSARASRVIGMSKSIAFAVARLITRSNFVAISTGRSAG